MHISHRGNLYGPNPEQENRPAYVMEALQHCDCMVDVWMCEGWYLGSDAPVYKTDYTFLQQSGLWLRARNTAALEWLVADGETNCFWHNTDSHALTTSGYIWSHPGVPTVFGGHYSIAYMPEWAHSDVTRFGGVCSDYIDRPQQG